MVDPDMQSNILIALYALSGLVWVGSALTAYMGFRAFRQRIDIGWAIAFLFLAAFFFGQAYVGFRWSELLSVSDRQVSAAAELPAYYQLRLAAIALVPSLVAFFTFRKKGARPS